MCFSSSPFSSPTNIERLPEFSSIENSLLRFDNSGDHRVVGGCTLSPETLQLPRGEDDL
jgi:hypothetical protein